MPGESLDRGPAESWRDYRKRLRRYGMDAPMGEDAARRGAEAGARLAHEHRQSFGGRGKAPRRPA